MLIDIFVYEELESLILLEYKILNILILIFYIKIR